MKAFLLIVHVVAAIVLIGPFTVAASVFPRSARQGAAASAAREVLGAWAVASAMLMIARASSTTGV